MNHTPEPDSYACIISTEELVPPLGAKRFAAQVVRVVHYKANGECEDIHDYRHDFPMGETYGDDELQAFMNAHEKIRNLLKKRGVDPAKVNAFGASVWLE